MFMQVVAALVVVMLGYIYMALRPPRPRICGLPNGPPVTSPRIKLSDGRHLAYREVGVSKEDANYKIIVVHGVDSSKDLILPVSQELIKELRIYFLFFDRAGYGESDPYPQRSVKSDALDIQELADALGIGSKFYVIGISMGAYPVWSCLKYIPQRHDVFDTLSLSLSLSPSLLHHIFLFKHVNRLSGVALVVPFVHYWWPSIPQNLSTVAFKRLPMQYQWVFCIARHAPWLFYWWMTQRWFPSLSITVGNLPVFSQRDLEILKKLSESPPVGQEKISQQGVYESLHRDLMVGYGKWEFDPFDLENPFPNNEGSVHIWQGYEDKLIPFQINRFISEKLSWIQYHEVPDGGHLMIFEQDICESVLKALLLG
ncbi:hypothetical protein Ancab_007574 [Ancistrocladus abbreviatus]